MGTKGGSDSLFDFLKLIEEDGLVGTWSWAFRANSLVWSPGVYRVLGLDSATTQPSFSFFRQFVHPDDKASFEPTEALLRRVRRLDRNIRIIRPDGALRHIRSRAEVFHDDSGQPLRATGLFVDMTAQNEASDLARLAKERFTQLAHRLGTTVWTIRPTAMDIDIAANQPGMVQSFQPDWLASVHPDDRQKVHQRWKTAHETKASFRSAHRSLTGTGQYGPVLARAAPVFDQDGNVVEWLGITIAVEGESDTMAEVLPRSALTGSQIRAGRAILNWSAAELASAANVSASSVRRMEEAETINARPEIHDAVMGALENGGVHLFWPRNGKPGVAPR